MGITVDFSELDRLAADLGDVPAEAEKTLKSALQFTATRVKRGAARKVSGRRHFAGAAAAIDYEMKGFTGFGAHVLEVEVGYNESRGGASKLSNLIEFGAPGSPNALTPGNELQRTLHEEEEDFVRGIGRALDDAHRKAGLA